ncbi:hypothetical protein QJQ45_003456 [Haematococcus lacustris]|nr:hypothetical protein QJQ45_003456 [Haematococcus lacustris]
MKWVSRHHYHQERGVAVYLGAGNFSQGGWKAGAVREGFRRVVQQPSRPSTFDRPDRLVIVDEFRTTRVSSSVHTRQPCELHLPDDRPRPADWVPPAGQVNQRLLRPAWSLRHAKDVRGLKWCHEEPPPPAQDQPPAQAPPGPVPRPQAPPWGRWLDRDTNPCLNFQRIGESVQRPLELCSWDDLEALPPVGKEYQQGYKRVNDRLPKLEEDTVEVFMERHGRAKQLVVFFGAAGIGTGGGWGADVVLQACCTVVRWPRGKDQLRGRVVLVDEQRTTRVSFAVNGQKPSHQGKAQGKAAKAKPAPQPGRWLDRDCNAALNMQRIGESRWRPLELCWWPEQAALPAKGKEYSELGYKRLRDRPPKAQQQPATAQKLASLRQLRSFLEQQQGCCPTAQQAQLARVDQEIACVMDNPDHPLNPELDALRRLCWKRAQRLRGRSRAAGPQAASSGDDLASLTDESEDVAPCSTSPAADMLLPSDLPELSQPASSPAALFSPTSSVAQLPWDGDSPGGGGAPSAATAAAGTPCVEPLLSRGATRPVYMVPAWHSHPPPLTSPTALISACTLSPLALSSPPHVHHGAVAPTPLLQLDGSQQGEVGAAPGDGMLA